MIPHYVGAGGYFGLKMIRAEQIVRLASLGFYTVEDYESRVPQPGLLTPTTEHFDFPLIVDPRIPLDLLQEKRRIGGFNANIIDTSPCPEEPYAIRVAIRRFALPGGIKNTTLSMADLARRSCQHREDVPNFEEGCSMLELAQFLYHYEELFNLLGHVGSPNSGYSGIPNTFMPKLVVVKPNVVVRDWYGPTAPVVNILTKTGRALEDRGLAA